MIIKHTAGQKDWKGVELPDDPGLLVAAIPGVTPAKQGGAVDWGKCAHLVVMGIKEEQNRIVTNARRMEVGRRKKEELVPPTPVDLAEAAASALVNYTPGCSYKAKPSALDEAMKVLRKAGVPMTKVVQAATQGMGEAQLMQVKAGLVKAPTS